MPLPAPVEALWNDLQSGRARLLKEIEGLSQAQADWRTSDKDWSLGEIVHHLTLAEIGTGKVTSKVLKDAGDAVKPFPAELKGFTPLPTPSGGRAEAPQAVWPERGKPFGIPGEVVDGNDPVASWVAISPAPTMPTFSILRGSTSGIPTPFFARRSTRSNA